MVFIKMNSSKIKTTKKYIRTRKYISKLDANINNIRKKLELLIEYGDLREKLINIVLDIKNIKFMNPTCISVALFFINENDLRNINDISEFKPEMIENESTNRLIERFLCTNDCSLETRTKLKIDLFRYIKVILIHILNKNMN